MKKIYLCLFSLILLSSCQIEESILPEEQKNEPLKTVSIEMAISEWPISSSKSMTKQGEEAFVVPKLEEFYYSDISNSQEKLLVIPADHKNPGVSSKIFILEVNGEIQTKVFNMYPAQPQTTPYFSGEIGIFSLEGEFSDGFRVENGLIVSKFAERKSTNKMVTDGYCNEHGNCHESSICIHCEQYLAEANLGTIPATSPSEPETIYVINLYPTYQDSGDGELSVDYTTGSGEGGTAGTTPTPTEEEDKINTDNLNNDCVEGIIEKLKKKDSHLSVVADPEGDVSHLSQIMLNMFEKSSKYHLNFEIADATDKYGNPRNAVTETANTPLGVTFTITLDDDYVVNATQLAIARSIVHETLHGYLKYINQEYPTSDLSQLIYKYYRDNNGDPNKTHHEVMTLFAEAMGASLAAWDNHNIPPPLDPNRLDYYEALSFSGGMIKSTSFSQLHSDDQDLIKLANKQEGNAVSPAESSAKSSKCP